LEDHAVLFAWDDSNDAFRVTCDGDRAVPDSLLEGLEEDTDLRGFLPQRRVSAGDTWRVGPEAYCRLYALGGAIPCAQIGGEDLTGVLEQPLFRALEGDLRVQLAGFEHADGTDVAVLEFRGDLKGRLESEGELGAILLGWGYPVEGEIQRMAELAIYVEGTLLWDAAEDRAISASLAGDVKLLREAIYTTAGSYRSESRERTSWEGTLRCELAVE